MIKISTLFIMFLFLNVNVNVNMNVSFNQNQNQNHRVNLTLSIGQKALGATEVDDIHIKARREKGHRFIRKRDQKTMVRKEVLSEQEMIHKKATNLSEALQGESGVDIQLTCASCGSKRPSFNGLRGEHTTILVDGMPLHSAVSSFYGMDAVPIMGLESVELLRGAGSSSIAPEALGGVISLQTIIPKENSYDFASRLGEFQTQELWVRANRVWENNRISIGMNASSTGPYDGDDNGVSEAPSTTSQGAYVKWMYEINKESGFDARFSFQQLSLLGGVVHGERPSRYPGVVATNTDFINGDVRERFIGNIIKISDLIEIDRKEYALRYHRHLSDDWTFYARQGVATQTQESLYMHGYDYESSDLLSYSDLKWVRVGQHHHLSFGLDFKNHSLKSDSNELYGNKGLKRDNFLHQALGFYLQDEWNYSHQLDITMALRVDDIKVNWQEYGQINEQILAPRISLKYQHHQALISRISAGLGYRAPLSLYESQHGSDHDGFEIAIDRLEKARSVGYTLDYYWKRSNVRLSLDQTWLDAQAYGLEREGEPLLFDNIDQESRVSSLGLAYSNQLTPFLAFNLNADYFHYNQAMKETFPVAPLEERVIIKFDYHPFDEWEFVATGTFTGSRDLSAYGYDQHFHRYDGINTSELKRQVSPDFWQWDFLINYESGHDHIFSVGVLNLFDYTQASVGDSPLTWDLHGPGDIHLDNFHLWGPNRGRQFYVGYQASFD